MAGSNTRRPSWADDRLVDLLSKTDAIDLAWMLAQRLNGQDTDDPMPILGLLVQEAEALGRQDVPMRRAAKVLREHHDKLKAGHRGTCVKRGRRLKGYTPPHLRASKDPAWACRPDCPHAEA